jgi:hypothetical protein
VVSRITSITSIGLLALLVGCGGGGGGGTPPPSPAPVDTTPNGFTFTGQSGSARSATINSNDITVTGINSAAPISITGGEYSIDGGAFTSAAGTINNNQRVTVRVNTSGDFSTAANAVLTVGGVSATFTATTLAADTTPDAFAFNAGGGGHTRNVVLTSNNVTIAGLNTGAPISIANGEYSINGGAFTAAAGTITNNQQVTVRLTTSGQFSTAVNAVLTIGGVTGAFSATTLAADTTPDAFTFARSSNATRNSWVNSAGVTITGINTGSPVTVENGEYAIAGGAFTASAGSIDPDQALVVRVRASATYSQSTRVRVTVGGVAAEFEAVAELPNYVPDVIAYDGTNLVYLLNSANRLVYRWSVSESRYLDPYSVGIAGAGPSAMAYSTGQQRLYLGYSTGAVRYIDPNATTPTEVALATMNYGVSSLSNAGNFLLAQTSGGYSSGYVLNSAGAIVAYGGYYYGYSRETAWDPVTSRVYYMRDGISPNDLHYDVINQTSGQITESDESPYHGSYNIMGPIRVTANGNYVLLGSGDIYDRDGLDWSGSLGSQVADARWFTNGSIVTLTTASSQTTLRRRGATNLATLEQLSYSGEALRVVGTDARMAVIVRTGTNPSTYNIQIHTYVPNDDSDGDGVTNTQDAFPLDRAASVDTDRDGYPDAWNSGRSQADSTTGLTLDAFAQDSACWLAAHANTGGTCNYGATMPNYTPDEVVQNGDTIYLLSAGNRRVYRWSISTEQYLNPYVVGIDEGFTGIAPTKIAFSAAHQRLYVGYPTGAIRYIDVAGSSAAEVPYTNISMSVQGLASVGNYVLAQDPSGAWATHYIIDRGGVITHSVDWNYHSNGYAWDPVTSRVYFFRDDSSPNDLLYEVIDQATGQITGEGETPYHGHYTIQHPIRVSHNGQYILLGSGDIYERNNLDWSGSLGGSLADARWLANGQLVTLRWNTVQTTLQRLRADNLGPLESVTFTGAPLRIVGTDARMTLLLLRNGTVHFEAYVPDDDSDDDGVDNSVDAFPLDRAASVDSDGDGRPNAWNAGRSQADSTTGLTLDVFPNDVACWDAAHGSGGVCNYGATMPNYLPDNVVQQGDIVYLLSTANRRVYRWSISTGAYLNPYVVGYNQGFTTVAPSSIAYSPGHQRLYLGYSNGAIRYLDLTQTNPTEQAFASLSTPVTALTSAGSFVVARSDEDYIINRWGAILAQGYSYGDSGDFTWDPVNSRLYYLSGYYGYYLHYDVVDQGTGQITESRDTSYTGNAFVPPVRVSANGQYIVLGGGQIYTSALASAGALGAQISDARWLADGSLVTLTSSSNQTSLRRLGSSNLATLELRTFAGAPLRVLGSDTTMVVLVNNNGNVQFHNYIPSDDSDGDGVANTADAFPLDVAASVDTDHDGYPDAWNAGRSQADSTTGLTLDAFPNDAACWLTAHGSGGVCNYGATIPNYTPDAIAQNGDTIYLLSSTNRRVYRRSVSTGQYLNPYIVGLNQGYSTLAPTAMAYSTGQQRLYLGYGTGLIRYIDVNTSNSAEVALTTMQQGVSSLANAGNFLAVQGQQYSYGNGSIVNSTGTITDQGGYYYGYSRDTTWDPVTSRLYFTREGLSPNDLHYDVINQTTGEVTESGETPYHGSYTISSPIRVSADGLYVLLGSGDIYNRTGLTWARSLGAPVADARWLADGTLVTLTISGNQTVLRRLSSSDLSTLEQRTFAGQALRLLGSDTQMVLVLLDNGTLQFQGYVPDDDSDDDGFDNPVDAFPLDVAASVDTDRDGFPDAWNAGRSQSDSTTGLTLDAFPNDAACWLSSHGSGGVCNYGATIPNYVPDAVAQNGDTIYLLNGASRRVYRRSISGGNYLNPYVVGLTQGLSTVAPTKMVYSSAHQRLYFGYSTGAVRYIDVTASNPVETAFGSTASAVYGLTSAGSYLVAHSNERFVFNSAGTILAHGGGYAGYTNSRDYAWDPGSSRLYYFRDGLSPNDLHYEVIDQGTGQFGTGGETPYHGSYNIAPPIRPSNSGLHILLGSGDIYNRDGLTWSGSLGAQINEARWLANGSLVTLTTSANQTILRRHNNLNLGVIEQISYTGQALRVLGSDTSMVVLLNNNGNVQFHNYVPDDDSDDDGVDNAQDAFPLDRAASVDTDRDGYPDAWNPGRTQADSTTGLALDAFPNDAACWLTAHGSGGVCNYGATMPNYVPDQIVTQGDTVYLLSTANRRVYRWSIATGAYLNPYVVGISTGFSTLSPTEMAYSPAHQRLYLGYETGAIQYINVNGSPTEVPFSNIAMAVNGLASVGNYLLAQDYSGAWATHYVINSAGAITDSEEWNHHSPDYAWDPNSSRVYWFSMWSPADLNYEVIDQATGQITGEGESPYHGDFPIIAPIRVSTDGERILLGSGNLYARSDLTIAGPLGKQIKDAHWTDSLLVDVDTTDRVEIRDANSRTLLASYQYLGTPQRLVFGQTEAYLVHVVSGQTQFVRLPFYDQDGDGMPVWWEQTYGLNDSNAGDAAGDLDGDGLSNANEYGWHSRPNLADSDGDALSDGLEVGTYGTDPNRADSDGDGLNDYAEVITHHSDPHDTDSDNDSYNDFDEVLYGGNPNNPAVLPQPMTSYSQTFEGTPNLSAWTMPPQSSAPWAIDTTFPHGGSAALRSGAINNAQSSSVKFRGFFTNGTLSFWARVDTYYWDRLTVLVNGVAVFNITGNQWTRFDTPITLGIREIEWRYTKTNSSGTGADAIWIDDVAFTQ